MNKQSNTLKLAVVTPIPPSRSTLNEYAFHLVKALRAKPEVVELTVLSDELPDGQSYETADPSCKIDIVPCWRFGAGRSVPRRAPAGCLAYGPEDAGITRYYGGSGGGRCHCA